MSALPPHGLACGGIHRARPFARGGRLRRIRARVGGANLVVPQRLLGGVQAVKGLIGALGAVFIGVDLLGQLDERALDVAARAIPR